MIYDESASIPSANYSGAPRGWRRAGSAHQVGYLGANERIRIGLIGAGSRGREIFRAALRCANVEAVGVADVYTRCLEEAKAMAPHIETHKDFRRILEDKIG